jgi:hypothetical protein
MPVKVDEVSLKDVIIGVKGWWKYLLSKWLIILAVGSVGGIAGFLYAGSLKSKYTAELSFVLSNDSKSAGGLLGLATQFGLDNGGNGDLFSEENIKALMMSQKMIKKSLFKKSSISNELLINIMSKELKFDKGWQESEYLRDAFPFPENPDKLSRVQDSLVRFICGVVRENLLKMSKPDKEQSIFVVATTSTKETFSYDLTRYLVDETASFYIATKTKMAKQNLDMLQKEADSLRRQLGGAIVSTAEAIDQTFNLNPSLQVRRSNATQGQTNATVIGTAYGEVVRNLEIAKITLQKATPLFQVIDEPQLPLIKTKLGRLKTALVGAVIAGMLTVFCLVVRKLYRNIIK